MEKTGEECIKFLRDWISKNGTTEKLERLLYRMEHENVIQADLIPQEIFHDLCEGNLSPIPFDMIPKIQEECPDYNWDDLAKRGHAILHPVLH